MHSHYFYLHNHWANSDMPFVMQHNEQLVTGFLKLFFRYNSPAQKGRGGWKRFVIQVTAKKKKSLFVRDRRLLKVQKSTSLHLMIKLNRQYTECVYVKPFDLNI